MLRVLHLHNPNVESPYFSPFAANIAWLPEAQRALGHEVTVRQSENPALEAISATGYDVVHIHESGNAYPEYIPGSAVRLVTGYGLRTAAGRNAWVALSGQHARSTSPARAAVIYPAFDAESAPAAREAGDHLAFAFDGHDEFALAGAIALAHAVERPLTVLLAPGQQLSEACAKRIEAAGTRGGLALETPERLAYPGAIASAAAYLALGGGAFDMPALAAMAAGTPVVTLRTLPAAEIIVHGESGFACETLDEAGRALERLDLLRPDLARVRARIAFDAPVAARRYLDLYAALAGGQAPVFVHPELGGVGREDGELVAA